MPTSDTPSNRPEDEAAARSFDQSTQAIGDDDDDNAIDNEDDESPSAE